MADKMQPNRYGEKGANRCRHRVLFHVVCEACNELLSWIADPELREQWDLTKAIPDPAWRSFLDVYHSYFANEYAASETGPPEYPNLMGTGNVVDLPDDPLAELAALGDPPENIDPEGGGSILA